MRIWRIHPKFLDSRGLVSLWHNGLFTQHLIMKSADVPLYRMGIDETDRIKQSIDMMGSYLEHVWQEARQRGYRFSKTQMLPYNPVEETLRIALTDIKSEFALIQNNLRGNDPDQYKRNIWTPEIVPHPMFSVVRE